jgi:hypothetical protein
VAQQQAEAADVLLRVWLIWVMNGHSFQQGSALFEYGSKLTHTCACPNTVYRTATGDIASVVEPVDGSSGSGSSGLQQQPGAAAPAAGADAAAAAGTHQALAPIASGELLTTNYLGMGHKRLMSTPARQKHLQDKFLFECTCHRCVLTCARLSQVGCSGCLYSLVGSLLALGGSLRLRPTLFCSNFVVHLMPCCVLGHVVCLLPGARRSLTLQEASPAPPAQAPSGQKTGCCRSRRCWQAGRSAAA